MNAEIDYSGYFVHTWYGFCYFTVEGDRSTIYNLRVDEPHRRQGLSRVLIRMAKSEIVRLGCTSKPEVEAIPFNCQVPVEALVKLYRSEGLKVTNWPEEPCDKMFNKDGDLNCGECKHYIREVGLEDVFEDCAAGHLNKMLTAEPGEPCDDFKLDA
jgi:GNAT superfamily N-acetyltransferase